MRGRALFFMSFSSSARYSGLLSIHSKVSGLRMGSGMFWKIIFCMAGSRKNESSMSAEKPAPSCPAAPLLPAPLVLACSSSCTRRVPHSDLSERGQAQQLLAGWSLEYLSSISAEALPRPHPLLCAPPRCCPPCWCSRVKGAAPLRAVHEA